jgi:hypothetical protein
VIIVGILPCSDTVGSMRQLELFSVCVSTIEKTT